MGDAVMWEYRATLDVSPARSLSDLVHDGDTVRVMIDQGFRSRTEQSIRLTGVRAAELGSEGADQARLFVLGWLKQRINGAPLTGTPVPLRWPLRVVTELTSTREPNERMSHERYLGWIYDLTTGECLNERVASYIAAHPEWPLGRDLKEER